MLTRRSRALTRALRPLTLTPLVALLATGLIASGVSTGSAAESSTAAAHAATTFQPALASTTRATTALAFGPSSLTRAYGTTAALTAHLTRSGSNVPGVELVFQRRLSDGTWQSFHRATTNTAGVARYAFVAKSGIVLRAVFSGNATLAHSVSRAATVRILGRLAMTEAAHKSGDPYVYGAAGPTRFDCSGLAQYVFRVFGHSLPRTANEQYAAVHHVAQSSRQIGDLIFFGSPGSIWHVGVYAGNNRIWHAPHAGQTVRLTTIWTANYLVGRVG